MPAGAKTESKACACGEAHYCHAEIMEIVFILRGLSFSTAGDAERVNELLKRYDREYYRRRNASKARP